MTKIKTNLSAAFAVTLIVLALAACGGATGDALPTGTPNMAQAQPSGTAQPLLTATTVSISEGATVTPNPPTATSAPAAATDTPAAAQPSNTPIAAEPTPKPAYPPEAEAAVTAAKAMLAKGVGVRPEAITVISVKKQTWTENGYGCPAMASGMAKLDIPGYSIVLEAQKNQYEFHTNADGSTVRACPNGTIGSGGANTGQGTVPGPQPVNPGSGNAGGTNMTQDQITEAAKADLAKRLAVDTASIAVKSVQEQQWPNSGMGCGKGIYLQVITPGYLIILTTGGQDYEYHTNMNGTVVLCVNGEPAQP